jgi:hypothetical protein
MNKTNSTDSCIRQRSRRRCKAAAMLQRAHASGRRPLARSLGLIPSITHNIRPTAALYRSRANQHHTPASHVKPDADQSCSTAGLHRGLADFDCRETFHITAQVWTVTADVTTLQAALRSIQFIVCTFCYWDFSKIECMRWMLGEGCL